MYLSLKMKLYETAMKDLKDAKNQLKAMLLRNNKGVGANKVKTG